MRSNVNKIMNKTSVGEIAKVNEIRERALIAAGFTPENMGEYVRLAVDKLLDQLDARDTKFFSDHGTVTDEREVPDHATQRAAATELLRLGVDLTGLSLKKVTEASGPTNIVFDLSNWQVTQPPVIEIHDSTEEAIDDSPSNV
jgi:hypothetical protein